MIHVRWTIFHSYVTFPYVALPDGNGQLGAILVNLRTAKEYFLQILSQCAIVIA